MAAKRFPAEEFERAIEAFNADYLAGSAEQNFAFYKACKGKLLSLLTRTYNEADIMKTLHSPNAH